MELNSLVSMFDELEVDDCLSIEGGSQNVAGVVVVKQVCKEHILFLIL